MIIISRSGSQTYYVSNFYRTPPWYEEILLPMDFGRLPLQSYCDDPYSPILMIYGAYERRGIKLCSVGRNKSFVPWCGRRWKPTWYQMVMLWIRLKFVTNMMLATSQTYHQNPIICYQHQCYQHQCNLFLSFQSWQQIEVFV